MSLKVVWSKRHLVKKLFGVRIAWGKRHLVCNSSLAEQVSGVGGFWCKISLWMQWVGFMWCLILTFILNSSRVQIIRIHSALTQIPSGSYSSPMHLQPHAAIPRQFACLLTHIVMEFLSSCTAFSPWNPFLILFLQTICFWDERRQIICNCLHKKLKLKVWHVLTST